MQVTASAQGQQVGRAQGTVGQGFALQVPSPQLWSPGTPFLYDLEVQLLGNQQGMVSRPLSPSAATHHVCNQNPRSCTPCVSFSFPFPYMLMDPS